MSGLSWLTILRQREHFRAAFLDFEPVVMARFGARDVARLMADEGIVRNRAKIDAVINNARRVADLVEEFGSFAAYVWRYEPRRRVGADLAPEAVALSKDLRRRGWAFVGPTTAFSFMQAMGLVNDHVRGCAAGAEVERLRKQFVRP
jgi:DNA-3-methyladenine glycosylase I